MSKGSINKVILIGNLGSDPELRSTPSGVQVANFGLATSESWTDKGGERQGRAEHRYLSQTPLGRHLQPPPLRTPRQSIGEWKEPSQTSGTPTLISGYTKRSWSSA